MSSNVGLTTPRGSGTSGYVQRNHAFMKPRNAGFGAPYPPPAENKSFRQRQPDKKILEHDRRRAVEVKVMEERERLEEVNEEIEEELAAAKKSGKGKKPAAEGEGEGDKEEGEEVERRVLSEEEIEERCEALRKRLLEEDEERPVDAKAEKRRQFKSYQVHELAEAKIEESERLRKALGIREDRETGEIIGREGGRRD